MPAPSLSDLIAPDHTALLIQEMQNGVVGPESALPELAAAGREVGLIENCARLAASARLAQVRVVHTTAENLPGGFGVNRNARLFAGARSAGAANAPGSHSVAPVEEIGVGADDIVLPRYHGLSPFTDGPLDALLRNEGITTIVLAGVSLNVAILNMTFDAINRAYQVVIASDAVAGTPVSYGEQVLQNTLRLLATLTTTDDVVTAWKQ